MVLRFCEDHPDIGLLDLQCQGHCSSADSKEKVIEVTDTSSAWKIGDEVTIIGATSMGMQAVLLAFLIHSLSFNLWPFHFQDSSS